VGFSRPTTDPPPPTSHPDSLVHSSWPTTTNELRGLVGGFSLTYHRPTTTNESHDSLVCSFRSIFDRFPTPISDRFQPPNSMFFSSFYSYYWSIFLGSFSDTFPPITTHFQPPTPIFNHIPLITTHFQLFSATCTVLHPFSNTYHHLPPIFDRFQTPSSMFFVFLFILLIFFFF
jgi:hypothetical protein